MDRAHPVVRLTPKFSKFQLYLAGYRTFSLAGALPFEIILKIVPYKVRRSVGESETVEYDVVVDDEERVAGNATEPEGKPFQSSPYAADRRSFGSYWFLRRGQLVPVINSRHRPRNYDARDAVGTQRHQSSRRLACSRGPFPLGYPRRGREISRPTIQRENHEGQYEDDNECDDLIERRRGPGRFYAWHS